jgi:NAD(P)-dependent dehydrogenase (short-subunit alcohol dehydrogenase family)
MSDFTADAIGDLTGRRAVITGANSGLGLQTAVG